MNHNQTQSAVNKLASIQKYLIWIADKPCSDPALEVINESMRLIFRESFDLNEDYSLPQAWDAASKWEDCYNHARSIYRQNVEALRSAERLAYQAGRRDEQEYAAQMLSLQY